MSHESREAIIRAEEQLKQLGKELELDRYLRVDDDPYPSKRVFKLLKNIDLESVTFANVQSAGNPMYLEKLNRQELFDLCLVNFARLSCAGEWDGLLETAQPTTQTYNLAVGSWTGSDGEMNSFPPASVYGRDTDIEPFADGLYLLPFLAPSAETVDAFSIHAFDIADAGPIAGIYTANSDGTPNELEVSCQFSTSSGLQTQASLTGSLDFTRGDLYYLALIPGDDSQRYYTVNIQYQGASVAVFPQEDPATGGALNANMVVWFDAGTSSLPATIDPADFTLVISDFPVLQYRVS